MADDPSKPTYAEQIALLAQEAVDSAYFLALGRFMDQFSVVEALLYHLLVAELGLELKLAATVLSGAKSAECIASLKRIFESRGVAVPVNLATLFEHVGTLTTARNEIVHFGSWGNGSPERTVRTDLKAHTAKKAKRWQVSATTLTDMYWDAEKATWGLLAQMAPNVTPKEGTAAATALKRAWQYKYPAGPTQSGKKPERKGRRTGQAPKGQPEPSGQ